MAKNIKLVFLLCLSAAAVFSAPKTAFAHPVAQGSLKVILQPAAVRLEARISMEELLVYSAQEKERPIEDLVKLWRIHGEYILKHMKVRSESVLFEGSLIEPQGMPEKGAVLPPIVQDQGFVKYEWLFTPEIKPPAESSMHSLEIKQDILNEFEYAPGNRWEATFIVRVLADERLLQEGLLLTSRTPLSITIPTAAEIAQHADANEEKDRLRMITQFLQHGIFHILTGYDHLLFVGALVLATVTLWDLIKIITAFTLAHTLTLTLATFNIVRLPTYIVEPFIAASIVFVAIQNIFWPKASRNNGRLMIAFFFGLFHGLGFAGGLLDAMQGMSIDSLWIALISFSIGVELGHQIVVLPVFAGLTLIRRMQDTVEKQTSISLLIQRIGSIFIALAGFVFLLAALQSSLSG
jgi:hypothetical protein